MSADNCPSCNASLIGDPIPEKYRVHQEDCGEQTARLGRCFCLAYGDVTHFRREIGQEIPGVYDGILFWTCPDCGFAWQRWSPPNSLYARAARYIERCNAPEPVQP